MIKQFIARMRFAIFKRLIESEIYDRIFPHKAGTKQCGYPFVSDREFQKQCMFEELDAKLHLRLIEEQAEQMPRAYGQAFRFIAYRDLNWRMKQYLKLVQQRVPKTARIPKFA